MHHIISHQPFHFIGLLNLPSNSSKRQLFPQHSSKANFGLSTLATLRPSTSSSSALWILHARSTSQQSHLQLRLGMAKVGVDYGQSWPTHYDNLYCVDTSRYYTYIIAIYYITRVYVYIYIYIYVCVCVCGRVCMCMCICICMCTYMYMYMHMHMYMHMYMYMYMCVYIHPCIYINK